MNQALVRRYRSTPLQVTLGAAVQTFRFEFDLAAPCKLLAFGAQSVTTVPVNDPLLTAWLVSLNLTINGTENLVPTMSRQDYINLVQNTEIKEGDLLLGTGNMIYKKFDPPLPTGTKIQMELVANTLALGTTTPAGSCVLTPVCYAFDSVRSGIRKATYYSALNAFPPVAGVTVNVPVERSLGLYARVLKALMLISENPAGTPVDTYLGETEIQADGKQINYANAPEMKKQYGILSDGIATPAGWYGIVMPEGGFQTAQNSQLVIQTVPYLTVAGGQIRGYEIFEKPF